MSVSTATSTVSYTGNNSTVTAYVVPFTFFDSSDLVVVKRLTATGVETTLTETTDYVVTGGDGAAGSLVTVAAIPNTYTVVIYREIPVTQPLSYIEADDFPAASHEEALDRLTYIAQQNARRLALAFRVTEASGELDPIEIIVNGLVGTDANGNAVMLTGSQVQTLLNLPATVIDQPTKTFADASARGSATPDFLGQVGVQLDTSTIYTGTSIAAGGWTVYNFTVAADSVDTANIKNSAVTAAKIATDAVETAKIKDLNVTAAKLAADAVETAKIKDANVTTAKLADGAVTSAKVAAGAVVQVLQDVETDVVGVTATIPLDNSVPQVSEGYEILSQAITPASATDKVLVSTKVHFGSNSSINVVVAVFRGSTCIAADSVGSNNHGSIYIELLDSPASASEQTYSVRVGNTDGASLFGVNAQPSAATARVFGGVSQTTLILKEIKA